MMVNMLDDADAARWVGQHNVRVELGTPPPTPPRQAREDATNDRKYLWGIFNTLDQNRSGSITISEVRALLLPVLPDT